MKNTNVCGLLLQIWARQLVFCQCRCLHRKVQQQSVLQYLLWEFPGYYLIFLRRGPLINTVDGHLLEVHLYHHWGLTRPFVQLQMNLHQDLQPVWVEAIKLAPKVILILVRKRTELGRWHQWAPHFLLVHWLVQRSVDTEKRMVYIPHFILVLLFVSQLIIILCCQRQSHQTVEILKKKKQLKRNLWTRLNRGNHCLKIKILWEPLVYILHIGCCWLDANLHCHCRPNDLMQHHPLVLFMHLHLTLLVVNPVHGLVINMVEKKLCCLELPFVLVVLWHPRIINFTLVSYYGVLVELHWGVHRWHTLLMSQMIKIEPKHLHYFVVVVIWDLSSVVVWLDQCPLMGLMQRSAARYFYFLVLVHCFLMVLSHLKKNC
eukprot:g7439.t1